MSAEASTSPNQSSSLVRSILLGGIIVAVIHTVTTHFFIFNVLAGSPYIVNLQYIASSLLGNAAFEGGLGTALLGLLLHLLVSLAIAGVFVLAVNRIALLRRYVIIGSLLHGLGVFIVMNFIVVPLSAAPPLPAPPPFLLIVLIAEHLLVPGLTLGILSKRNII